MPNYSLDVSGTINTNIGYCNNFTTPTLSNTQIGYSYINNIPSNNPIPNTPNSSYNILASINNLIPGNYIFTIYLTINVNETAPNDIIINVVDSYGVYTNFPNFLTYSNNINNNNNYNNYNNNNNLYAYLPLRNNGYLPYNIVSDMFVYSNIQTQTIYLIGYFPNTSATYKVIQFNAVRIS